MKNLIFFVLGSLLILNSSVTNQVYILNGGGGTSSNGEAQKYHEPKVMEYFYEVALGSEFGTSRKTPFKWTTDMKIFVDGQKPQYLMDELNRVVSELNSIINPINVRIVTNRADANYFIYFGSHTNFKTKYKVYSPHLLETNWGYFEVYPNKGIMYVDLNRTTKQDAHKHLLREELTQSLGLVNDSWEYSESIFYQGWTTTTEYLPIDRELIDILYND